MQGLLSFHISGRAGTGAGRKREESKGQVRQRAGGRWRWGSRAALWGQPRGQEGEALFLQGWGGRGRLSTLLHPSGLGRPCFHQLLGSPEGSGVCGGLSSLPALSGPLQPPTDPHLLCRRGKGLEIRGLAVSAKREMFS